MSCECAAPPAPRRGALGLRWGPGGGGGDGARGERRAAELGAGGREEGRGRGEGRARGGLEKDRPAEAPRAGALFTCCRGPCGRGRGAGGAEERARGSRAPAAAGPPNLRQAPPPRAVRSADLSPSTWRRGPGCAAAGKARPLRGSEAPGNTPCAITEAEGRGVTRTRERAAGTLTRPDLRPEIDATPPRLPGSRPELLPLPLRPPPRAGVISCPSCREQFEEPS